MESPHLTSCDKQRPGRWEPAPWTRACLGAPPPWGLLAEKLRGDQSKLLSRGSWAVGTTASYQSLAGSLGWVPGQNTGKLAEASLPSTCLPALGLLTLIRHASHPILT